ncbi:MAG: hypothetical protein ACU833_10155 [Gammaproteobacteria bacterium]
MSQYKLVEGLYLCPTPGGAYYAVSSTEEDKSRKFLLSLLGSEETPLLRMDALSRLTRLGDEEKCLSLLHHCQNLGWVQGFKSPQRYAEGALEEVLPYFMTKISESGKILLADNQGFYLSTLGFPHEVAEELSALSAEIATVHERRSGLLVKNLGLASSAWSIVDAFGNSRIGFWPIYIGKTRFVLILSGAPRFNQPEFVNLVWALNIRYAKSGGK